MAHVHSEECECGCHDETGPELYPPYAVLGIVGFMLAAISLLVSGISFILAFSHGGNVAWDPTIGTVSTYLGFIIPICLLVISAYGLTKGVYTESLFFVIFGVFLLIISCAQQDALLTPEAMRLVNVISGVFLMIPTIVFFLSKEGLLGLGATAVIVTLFLSEIVSIWSGDVGILISGIGFTIGAVIFGYIATANLLYAEAGVDLPLF